ncbi:hypothetical protein RHS01_00045 [Rhizoctonia solani]|uniref:Uncharacterized protein n=1 Tax=Rhizoctonia solani TaxID=456999 RepID=A0A8H7IMW3_9AGAM|nr:hypothetical protein RHS01_00045 [Rhizoctonia solani]
MFRSILREKNTPGSGQSVRWGARDAYRTITPNTSAASGEDAMHSPLYEDEEGSSFRARMQDESSDDHGEKIDQLAAMGQSVGSRFAASGSTTPPTSGPSKLSTSTLPPIPRPRFNPSAPSTSSPLTHDDSTVFFPDSMSPALDHQSSYKPFDMSLEMDSIPNIPDRTSPLVSDSSLPTRRASRPTRPSIPSATDDLTEQARKCMNVTAGPSKSIRGMTTVYPPGMYNFTKSTVIPSNPIPSFSAEPEVDPGPKPKSRSKFIDPVGSSSLDFIIAPGASLSRTARARTSLPPQPLPPFDPPPPPPCFLFPPEDESNLLARATTTKTFQISTRELPTFYPPGGYKFDPTQIDPDNIPELSRFFIPDTEGPDNSKLGPDASRGSVTIGHRHNASVGSVGSRKSLQLLDLDESNASTVSPSRVPLAVSKSVSRSRPNSLSSNSSFSGANPNSLADLTQLIESQYKADLAAHTALVPILLSRAETAEELERLCGELGHEVGLLKKERSELIADRERIANERDGLRTSQAGLEARIAPTWIHLPKRRRSRRPRCGERQCDAGDACPTKPGREGSQKESTEKGGEDEARARLAELESRLEDTEVRDLEVRVEREKDGSGAKEAFALERQQWEKERMALLDRAVRAEQALDVAKDPDTAEADQKLRRQLEEYKAEVESQWKYAEQADATIKALEADVNRLNKELENARKAGRRSPQSDEGWKRKEAEWERQRAEWERAKAESQAGEQARQEDMQDEIDALKEDMDGLAYERDAYQAELNEVRSELVKFTKERSEAGKDRAEIEDEMERMRVELEDARHERGSLEQKCDSLAQQLSSEQAARSSVAKEHQRVITRLEDLDREHQSSLDTIRRLERIVQARNTELAQTEESIRTQALEAEQLRLIGDLEDKEGLNVAFNRNSRLELIKRKLGVRGTAGATPAPSRMNKGSYSRRESTASSAALETPLPRAMIRKDYPDFAPSESTATASSYSVAATPLQTSSRANIYGTTAEVNITNPDTVKPGRRISDSIPLDHLCGLYP